jgi:hypothetical protein
MKWSEYVTHAHKYFLVGCSRLVDTAQKPKIAVSERREIKQVLKSNINIIEL